MVATYTYSGKVAIITSPTTGLATVPVRLRASRWPPLLAIALLALNLRSAITSVSPVLTEIQHQLHMSDAQASVLGSLPPIIFGLAGITTPAIVRRWGMAPTAAATMGLATAGLAVRSVSPDGTLFFVPQLVALAGMGMGNVLLPPLVKRYFPDRIGALTVVYGICLQLGTAVPAFLAVPLAEIGGWQTSLASWAAFSMVAMCPWILLTTGHRDHSAPTPSTSLGTTPSGSYIPIHVLLRNRVAWGAVLLMGTTSLNTYPMITWLPQILTDADVSRTAAGSLLGIYPLMSVPLALTIPWIAVRLRNPLVVVAFGLACYVVAYGGLALAPSSAPALWTITCGLAATGFPLALALVNLRTLTHDGAVALSGFMQGFGYLFAATGPLVVGLLHSLTDQREASFGFLGLTLIPLAIGGVIFCRPTALENTIASAGSSSGDTTSRVTTDR